MVSLLIYFLQTQGAVLLEKSKKDAKLHKLKKKKKLAVKRKHDDDCFRCGEGGELVMCDQTACTKSYHLSCLGLDKPPHGMLLQFLLPFYKRKLEPH